MNETNRMILVLMASAWIVAMVTIIFVAWAEPARAIVRIHDFAEFLDDNDTDAGKGVDIKGTYGASGDQSRAVAAGLDADEVHLSLEPDVTRLVDAGIVAKDWKDNDTQGICTQSVVVFVVQKGNPKGIESWSDLVKPGVGIVTPTAGGSTTTQSINNDIVYNGTATAADGTTATCTVTITVTTPGCRSGWP